MKYSITVRLMPIVVYVICTAVYGAGSNVYSQSTISGHVFDDQRAPIANLFVELQDENLQVLQSTRTNSSGVYFFRNLRPGTYNVRVKTMGTDLLEQTGQVDILSRPPRGSSAGVSFESKDFYLRTSRKKEVGKALIVFAQEVPDAAKKEYAIAELSKNNPAELLRHLEAAVGIFPTYFEALQMLGNEYVRLGKFSEALTTLKRALAVNTSSFPSWYGRAYAEYSLGMAAPAVDSATRAVTLRPDSAEASLLIGVSYRLAGNFIGAEKMLRKSNLLMGGNSADVHWNLALLYGHNLKRYDDAARELEEYLKTSKSANEPQIRKLIDQFRERAKSAPSS